VKNNLKNRPRPPKPLCPIGVVYEEYLEAFEAELREGQKRFKCFHCGGWFNRENAKECIHCNFLICPNCGLCFCQLEGDGKVVAQAMWDDAICREKEILG